MPCFCHKHNIHFIVLNYSTTSSTFLFSDLTSNTQLKLEIQFSEPGGVLRQVESVHGGLYCVWHTFTWPSYLLFFSLVCHFLWFLPIPRWFIANRVDSSISGHKVLLYSCEMLKPTPIYRQLQIRPWKFLDTEKFISELKLSRFQLSQVLMWTQLLIFIITFCQGSLTRWLLLRPLDYMKDVLIQGLIGSVVLQNVWKGI